MLFAALAFALVASRAGAIGQSGAGTGPARPGELVYRAHCAACHGVTGEGAPNWKRPNEQGELPAPPHGPEGHTWRHADAMLRKMIADGWRDRFNKTSRLTMPPFRSVLTAEQIDAVIDYLKTLWTPTQRRFQAGLSRPES